MLWSICLVNVFCMYIFVTSRSNRSSTSLFNIAHHHQRIPVKLDHPITKLFSRVSKGSAPIQKKTDVVGQVQEVVVNYFVHGEPDREIVASELNLSPRTLQRRLKEQNSSVKRTVDSTRHQLSISYLEQKHLSVKEVAYSLGFNDPSNFSRAFRRWEGITPKEYRKTE